MITLTNKNDTDCSRLCLEAIELIYTLGLMPTPTTYKIIYSHLAQTDLSTAPIINKALSEDRTLNEEEVKSLYQVCSDSIIQNEKLQNLTCKLFKEVSSASVVLEQAVETAETYRGCLNGTHFDLSELRDPETLASVVAGLVHKTLEMEKDSTAVHRRLSEISYEVETVKSDLDKVRIQSFSDSLTNTANRRLFDRAFAAAVADAETSGQPLCLCMVDADHFKGFNDRHGHQAGDSVLKLIASVLKNAVRDRDIVARYGGEEFAILLANADLTTGLTVAERIRSNLASKKLISRGSGESLGSITVSIGVAEYAQGESMSSLLERADNCLYQAKNNGRNTVVSEKEMNEHQASIELKHMNQV